MRTSKNNLISEDISITLEKGWILRIKTAAGYWIDVDVGKARGTMVERAKNLHNFPYWGLEGPLAVPEDWKGDK